MPFNDSVSLSILHSIAPVVAIYIGVCTTNSPSVSCNGVHVVTARQTDRRFRFRNQRIGRGIPIGIRDVVPATAGGGIADDSSSLVEFGTGVWGDIFRDDRAD